MARPHGYEWRAWTEREIRMLKELRRSGMKYAKIGEMIGRTMRAVKEKARATGVARRYV